MEVDLNPLAPPIEVTCFDSVKTINGTLLFII